jgi:hypothetical protein
MVLGDHVGQKGSNITAERLRFDFSHPEKMTPEQIQKVEDIVNQAIKADHHVSYTTMTLAEARDSGAIALFGDKYEEVVKVLFHRGFLQGSLRRSPCGTHRPAGNFQNQEGTVQFSGRPAYQSGARTVNLNPMTRSSKRTTAVLSNPVSHPEPCGRHRRRPACPPPRDFPERRPPGSPVGPCPKWPADHRAPVKDRP